MSEVNEKQILFAVTGKDVRGATVAGALEKGTDPANNDLLREIMYTKGTNNVSDEFRSYIRLLGLYYKNKLADVRNKLNQPELDVNYVKNMLPAAVQPIFQAALESDGNYDTELEQQRSAANVAANQPLTFKVNAGEIVRKTLFAIARAPVEEADEVPTDYGEYADMMDGNKWFRDAKGYYTVVNGDVVRYGEDDPGTVAKLKAGHSCYGTGLNDENCNQYIWNCLLSDSADADQLLQNCINIYNREGNFFEMAAKEIEELHPVIAVRTLQKFGFRTHSVYDSSMNMSLKKVESVKHWLENFVSKKFTKAQKDAVVAQGKLLGYLGMLVSFVNSNPGILNKGVQGTTDEAAGVMNRSDYLKRLDIPLYKQPSAGQSDYYDIARFRSQFNQYSAARPRAFSMTSAGRLMTPFGSVFSPGASMLSQVGGQSGGGGQTQYVLRKLKTDCRGANLISNVMRSLMGDLSSRGKELNEQSKAKITKQVEDLKKTEMELLKTMFYLEEYSRLLDMFKQYETEELSEDKLRQFVDRHSHLQGKQVAQEEYLLRILEKLGRLVGDDYATQPIQKYA